MAARSMVYEYGILAPGFGFVLSVAFCLLVLHSIWHLFSGVWYFISFLVFGQFFLAHITGVAVSTWIFHHSTHK
jgi:hypothetical protein